MTHRDELLALRARLEAQSRELSEVKAESELLRAAHAQKTRALERLRAEREDPEGIEREGADPHLEDDDVWADAPPPPDSVARDRARAYAERELRRPFAVAAMAMAMTALMGSFIVAIGVPARHRAARDAMATSRISAVGIVRVGTVVSGDPAVASVGEACAVSVLPTEGSHYDCRVEVRCGEHAIYGRTADTGYVRCAGRDIVRDAEFTARDGDPAMERDLVRGRVVGEEQLGLGTQRVEISLTPAH